MKKRVLFVCLGNICRSPLAEAVFNHHVKTMKLEGVFSADSCGTSNYHIGDPPDPRTVRNATKNGVMMNHRGRQLSWKDLDEYDLILAMDSQNHRNILHIANAAHETKIKFLRDFDPEGPGDVPDPYYGDEKDFQLVFEIVDRSIRNLILKLINEESH